MVTLPSASVVSCRILWSFLLGPTATRMFLSTSTGLEPPLAIPNTVTVMSAQTGDETAARTTTDASVHVLSRCMLANYHGGGQRTSRRMIGRLAKAHACPLLLQIGRAHV